MIKVLRIINRFNLGGPTYNVAYLSKYLSNDFETLLVGGSKDETEESSNFILGNLGLKPIIIEEMKREINIKQDYLAYKKIKQIILEYKPDVVHTHASKAGTLGRLAAYHCKVPVIVHTFHGHVFHSYFGKLTTTFYKTIERYLAKKSTAIIAISEKQKEELTAIHNICKATKITVVPLGFDLNRFQENQTEKRNRFRTKYHLDDDEIAISIIGRLVPVKNHSLFLNALKIVSEKTNKKIRAFIIGDGELRNELENQAQELNLDYGNGTKKNLLTFTSWIKEIDVALAGSDIIALTSFNEGTPVSLIEAQAANKPIVSTNVGGIEDVVIPNTTALLSANNNLEEFAANLLRLIEEEKLKHLMIASGWEFVGKKFHYTRLANDVQTLYKSLLKQVQ
jgi:glycosyltransferase involved in cell wall biosynthesis